MREPDPYALHAATLQQLQEPASGSTTSARPSRTRSEHHEQAPDEERSRGPKPRGQGGGFFPALVGIVWFLLVWMVILVGKLIVGIFGAVLWVMHEVTAGSERFDRWGNRTS